MIYTFAATFTHETPCGMDDFLLLPWCSSNPNGIMSFSLSLISGHDGGTGASPVSSIKHAGGPWELGLTETHQTLIENRLRERVVLRVDGGFKSGFDVMMAAAMGADEYGFGSVAMIATGCVMARICHTNNCPVGVASQREELRARFPGVPGDLVNYFLYVAEEDNLVNFTESLTVPSQKAAFKSNFTGCLSGLTFLASKTCELEVQFYDHFRWEFQLFLLGFLSELLCKGQGVQDHLTTKAGVVDEKGRTKEKLG
ncbi:hypothetical protein T459_08653 [Capsicum annuum]|uniref:Glutamate synthase domain-containing protein n=1 Tax=Capsicum annuum TaxID=4072 RepID=A0A2G2ZX35_CAPAN|nr:hypothetical protein T459_08653 [Capsicum annuum]